MNNDPNASPELVLHYHVFTNDDPERTLTFTDPGQARLMRDELRSQSRRAHLYQCTIEDRDCPLRVTGASRTEGDTPPDG